MVAMVSTVHTYVLGVECFCAEVRDGTKDSCLQLAMCKLRSRVIVTLLKAVDQLVQWVVFTCAFFRT
jgi:hypothetical protein